VPLTEVHTFSLRRPIISINSVDPLNSFEGNLHVIDDSSTVVISNTYFKFIGIGAGHNGTNFVEYLPTAPQIPEIVDLAMLAHFLCKS
jgi:hypothetical protein